VIVPPTTPEDGPLQIFSGNSNPTLAGRMARSLGIELGRAVVGTFANEETRVRIEQNVRGSDVFLLQSLSIPVDHHIIELCLMIDALKRASARRVTAVIPYYGYAKQEKKMAGREPISAKVIANLIAVSGADRILTIDLHAPAIEGFFDIPVDHLRAAPILAQHFRRLDRDDIVVVSPDAGGVAPPTISVSGWARRRGSSPSNDPGRTWPRCSRWWATFVGRSRSSWTT